MNILEKIAQSLEADYADSILFSGGIDSTALLVISMKLLNKTPIPITVSLSNEGSDKEYAKEITDYFNIPWIHKEVSIEEAVEQGIPNIIEISKSFDLGLILNDISYYFGMKQLLKEGILETMTGDGADWLFGGYSFLWNKKDKYNEYVKEVLQHLDWSSNEIAKELLITVKQPYLNSYLVNYALQIPFHEKIQILNKEKYGDVAVEICKSFEETNGNGKIWGKVNLRNALISYLPEEIIWRQKTDIEFGSGMTNLKNNLEDKISNKELIEIQKRTGIKFWGGKAQIYFYKIFESIYGGIKSPKEDERECNSCGSGVEIQRRHCYTCGYFDTNLNK